MRSGLPIERIREIRSPVGLDVRGRTPEEIAVSIMAEVLMFPAGRHGPADEDRGLAHRPHPREGRGRPRRGRSRRLGCGGWIGYSMTIPTREDEPRLSVTRVWARQLQEHPRARPGAWPPDGARGAERLR